MNINIETKFGVGDKAYFVNEARKSIEEVTVTDIAIYIKHDNIMNIVYSVMRPNGTYSVVFDNQYFNLFPDKKSAQKYWKSIGG